MFSLTVRDHFMIAHSFKGATFGPAQALHGATYVVDVAFVRPDLDAEGLVVDIGRASEVLKEILGRYNYRNLDEMAEFEGVNTTTEFMAKTIFDRMAERIAAGDLGPGAAGLTRLKATLGESHVAWAAYEGALPLDGA